MSMGWYFHTFHTDRLARVWGNATGDELRRLALAKVEDSSPAMTREEIDRWSLVVVRALTDGIAYTGLSGDEAALLDEVVQLTFHEMGLEQAVGARPVSPQALNIRLAGHLADLARSRWTDPLLALLAGGRRVGANGPSRRCGYIILNAGEADQMHAEASTLLADPTTPWADATAPAYAASDLLPALMAVRQADGLALYGHLT